MYGVITSLFSGLTIIGLIFTIIQQQESLRKQAQELELTKKALSNQEQELKLNRTEIIENREEIKLQHRTVKYQRFENTFFNMCSTLNHIIESLPSQRSMFESCTKRILFDLPAQPSTTELMESFSEQYNIIKRVDQYCTTVGKIIDIIMTRKKEEKSKKFYLEILLSQMSTVEKTFLFYYYFLRISNPIALKPIIIMIVEEFKILPEVKPDHFERLITDRLQLLS